MLKSHGFRVLGLACSLLLLPLCSTRVFGLPLQKPTDTSPAAETKDQPAKTDPETRADHAKLFALPGEDPPQPFVPLHPRTLEYRKRLEAITDFSVARALEERSAWDEAIVLLEKALERDPDSITILRRLSRLCFILGRTEPGIAYSKRALAADPGDTDTVVRLFNYYHGQLKDSSSAEALLLEVLANPKLGPHDPCRTVAEFKLGELYAGKLQKIDKAAESFAKVIHALDDKTANRLSPADQRRILGGDEAAAYQEFGLVFVQAKKYELAVTAFERGLDYEPDDPQLPLLLAKTLLKLDKGDKALALVEQYLKRQPQGVEGYELLGEILQALHRGDEITARLEQAAKVDSKNVGLQYALADRYRETGQVERAEALYKALLEARPTAQGYSALAASLLKRRKAEDLLRVVVEAVARGGLEAVKEPLEGIANDPELAEQVLECGQKLLSAEPPKLGGPALGVLSYIANVSNKHELLLPIERHELARNPNPLIYKSVSNTLVQMKKYEDAAATLEEMLQKYPAERSARTLVGLTDIYRRAEKPDRAEAAARDALRLEPNDLEAMVQLALVLSQFGKVDESVALLREAVKKDPKNPALSSILGGVLSQAGRNEDALALYKDLLDKFPNDGEVVRTARSNLSVIYVNMGDYAKGEAELELLFVRNPDDAGVNNDLGYLYADQGKNLEKAEAMIRKAVQEEPENSAYLDSLGWVLFKRGKAKDAVEPLEKAVQRLSDTASSDATIQEHLGDVYLQLQELGKAKDAWKAAEKVANKSTPPDKRLPEIRKKLESLEKLSQTPRPSTGKTP